MLLWLLAVMACERPLPDLDDAHRDLTDALPVFPGAEGFGTDTKAGRGGEVRIVDTLDDRGAGSLRAAMEASGPRTVVFEVAGVIDIREQIVVRDPYLTVAGQTAPSPGITVYGAGLVVETHDVLLQHLHVRVGDRPDGPKASSRDGISVFGTRGGDTDVFGVVVDHCSVSWAVDENGDTGFPGVRDVTFSNSLFTEGLWDSLHAESPHAKGLLVGTHSRRIAVLRNVFAHNHDRNPVLTADTSSIVANNLIYDPGQFAMVMYNGRGCCPSLATFRSNRMIPGKASDPDLHAVHLTSKISKKSEVYVDDCGAVLDERDVTVNTPPVTVLPLTVVPADDVEDLLFATSGARPADRDPVDERVWSDIRARTGGPIDSPKDVGGLPDLPLVRRALELPDDPGGETESGYTNLELWLHEQAEIVEGR